MDLSSLTLFPATPEQVLVSRRRTWPQWGGKLTEEQYIEKDRLMDAMEHAANSKLITWVLAPRDDPTSLDFMCSCETYRRRGLVQYRGSIGQDSEIQEVVCYGIASVFTPLDKRGRGYASHMMRLLHWVISGRGASCSLSEFPAEWGQPPPEVEQAGKGLFSVLYSDVGEFYQKTGPGLVESGGWQTRDPVSTVWEVPREPLDSQPNAGFTWLKREDVDQLWAKDVELIKRSIVDMPTLSGTTAIVSFLPDDGVASFQFHRSIIGTEDSVPMDTYGVQGNHTNAGQPTYAVWSVDTHPLPPTLIVIRLHATEETFPDLIQKIQEAARRHGIVRMEIWNLRKDLADLAAHLGGKTLQREEHLPAIKWYGEGDTANIRWVFNEKSAWRMLRFGFALTAGLGSVGAESVLRIVAFERVATLWHQMDIETINTIRCYITTFCG